MGPPYPMRVAGPTTPAPKARPGAQRPVRSLAALVVFAVVLGLIVALTVAAVVGVAVFAIQNALNG